MRQVYGPLLWRPGRPIGRGRCSGQQGCRNLGDLGGIYHALGFASDLPPLYLNLYLSIQVRWSCLGLYCVLLSLTVSWHIVGSLTGFFPGKPRLLSPSWLQQRDFNRWIKRINIWAIIFQSQRQQLVNMEEDRLARQTTRICDIQISCLVFKHKTSRPLKIFYQLYIFSIIERWQ